MMTETNQFEENETFTAENRELIPSFGQELLREHLLAELLGEEAPYILYWAGKSLARKFPLEDFDAIARFFAEASFGEIQILKEKKDEMRVLLNGRSVEKRFEFDDSPSFKLEAGFIAEAIQAQKGFYTESYDEINKRKKEVELIIKWDRKESIENLESY